MKINSIDHIVLTVKDIDLSVSFYTEVLGMELVIFGDNRKALCFGNQKINLHKKGEELEPKAKRPVCGSADLCFISDIDIETVKIELTKKGIQLVINKIVDRTGAIGEIRSLYLRDPDENLIEISNYKYTQNT